MKIVSGIEHIAVASNSEADSDKFFVELLGLKKVRSFSVSAEKMIEFFGVNQEQNFIRYDMDDLGVEVIITDDNSKSKDIFTHSCLIVEDRDKIVDKAISLGFKTIKVLRNDGNGFYLFIKDIYGNLYEIK